MKPHSSALRTLTFAAATLLAALPQAQAKILAQWVELGPDGTASARAITDDAACPAVVFDGVATPMATRSEPGQSFGNVKPASFPVRGCEVAVPAGAIVGLWTASRCRCRGPIRSAS